MSIIVSKGEQAKENIMSEGGGNFDSLLSFKSGTSYKIRLASATDYVEWYCHNVFKVFYSTPCTKPGGEPDLYDEATKVLYEDAEKLKKEGKEEEAEEVRQRAYQLKAKPRYMFGFYTLSDGKPGVLDVSKKQAQAIITGIDKFKKKIDSVAFEISKTGTGTNTTVTLAPVLDMEEDLTEVESKNWKETKGKEFDKSIFEKVLKVKSRQEQIKDLLAFGFDVSRIGVGQEETEKVNTTEVNAESTEENEEDIPF